MTELLRQATTHHLVVEVTSLLSDAVLATARVKNVVLTGTCAASVAALVSAFRPTAAVERLRFLKRKPLVIGARGDGQALNAALTFLSEFEASATAVGIQGKPAIDVLIDLLPAEAQTCVKADIALAGTETLATARTAVVAIATKMDECVDLGLVGRGSSNRIASSSNRAPSSSGGNSSGKGKTGKTHAISAEEYARRRTENACYRCGGSGHLARTCPSPERATEVKPKVEPAATDPSVSSSSAATASHRYPLRNQPQAPDFYKAHEVRCVPECKKSRVPLRIVRRSEGRERVEESFDVAPFAEQVVVDAVEAEPKVGDWSTGDPRPFVSIRVTGPEGTGAFRAVVDSGAERSMIRAGLAAKLGLARSASESACTFVSASGVEERTVEFVEIEAQLTMDAPRRTIRFWVTSSMPAGEYALLGLCDLSGFVVEFGNMPKILWRGAGDAGTEVDPVTVPDLTQSVGAANDGATVEKIPRPVGGDEFIGQDGAPWTLAVIGDRLAARPEKARAVRRILCRFAKAFELIGDKPAKLPEFKVRIVDGALPVRESFKNEPPNKYLFIEQQIAEWLRNDIVEPGSGAWATHVVCVGRGNGRYRLCGAYVRVNRVTVRDAYPIPSIPEIFAWISGKKWLAKTDMASGYLQIPLEEASRDLLAIITHIGLFRFKRTPFGPMNAPGHFSRVLAIAFAKLLHTRGFFDDATTAAAKFAVFLKALEDFFALSVQLELHLSPKKCVFGPSKLPLLGRLVGPKSVEVDPDRLSTLKELRAPASKSELHSFLGMAQYFAPFLPRFVELAKPLWPLMKANAQFVWSSECTSSFESIRAAIVAAPILAQFVAGAPIVIRPDFSSIGVGGAIWQRSASGKLEPLMFFGRKLLAAETRYATIEGECLGVVIGFEKARAFILPSTSVTVVTDHSNLQFMFSSENHRVQRWTVVLSEFAFSVVYSPGGGNVVADAISRLIGDPPLPVIRSEVAHVPVTRARAAAAQRREVGTQDAEQGAAADQSAADELAAIVKAANVLDDGARELGEPPSARVFALLFALSHEDILAGHFGVERTLARMAQVVRWSGMRATIANAVASCASCQIVKGKPPEPAAIASTAASRPFESVFVDFLGPLRAHGSAQYVLVMVDRFSHFVVLAAA